MFINGIVAGSAVKIVVTDNKKKVTLESEVIDIIYDDEHKLAVKAFRHNDTLIRFDCGVIKAYIDNYADGRSYVFPITCIYTDKDDSQESFHVLCSDCDAQYENKRGAVRVPLSEPVKVYRRSGMLLARPKDISCTGISFYACEEDGINEGEQFICEFEQLSIRCKVLCTVVRIIPKEDNKIIVGCKINGESRAVGELVNGIQLQYRRNFNSKR